MLFPTSVGPTAIARGPGRPRALASRRRASSTAWALAYDTIGVSSASYATSGAPSTSSCAPKKVKKAACWPGRSATRWPSASSAPKASAAPESSRTPTPSWSGPTSTRSSPPSPRFTRRAPAGGRADIPPGP